MSSEITPEPEISAREQATNSEVSAPTLLVRAFTLVSLQSSLNGEHSKAHVFNRLRQWVIEDNTPTAAPITPRPGETLTQALFRQWQEEDAEMIEDERDAEAELWADLEKSLLFTSGTLQMKPLDF